MMRSRWISAGARWLLGVVTMLALAGCGDDQPNPNDPMQRMKQLQSGASARQKQLQRDADPNFNSAEHLIK